LRIQMRNLLCRFSLKRKVNVMQLIQAGKKTYYIKSETNIGIYMTGPDRVALIDTGSWSDGEKIDEILIEQGWSVDYIINTHSHIDHLGGNKYFADKYGVKAYIADIEIPFAHYSDLETSYMNGGRPCSELRNIFVHPGKIGFSPIEEAELEGITWEYLPGHTFGMIGVKTDDDVWFLGDSYLNRVYMKKRSFGYLCDVGGYLNTLDRLAEFEGVLFVPAHGKAEEDISEVLELNKENMQSIIDVVKSACGEGNPLDLILRKMYEHFGMKNSAANHVLLSSTIKSYITYLQDRSEIECIFRDNVMCWKCV